MDEAEKFARFLAENGPANLSGIDGWIVSYLQRITSGGQEITIERLRLGEKFSEIGADVEPFDVIMDRIHNAPFKSFVS
ncbi:MAG TPA: hypothetical protein VNV38_07095 [Stellaceae bacterium]|jgi:hypothetical protein|nr:hypothetical protein [Stellaceae bacterium]